MNLQIFTQYLFKKKKKENHSQTHHRPAVKNQNYRKKILKIARGKKDQLHTDEPLH